MAYEGQGNAQVLAQRAASAIQAYQFVGPLVAGSQLDDTVVPGASGAVPLGVTRASHAAGDACEVIVYGVAKVKAGASLGAGAALAVGSLGLVVVPAASQPLSCVGKALVNAAAGDIFAALINPGYL
jgi:hypothetical protein